LKIKYLIAITLYCASIISAQNNFNWVRHDSLVKAGVNQIYGIEFDKAEKTFDLVQKEYPTHPSGKFFKAMTTWWRILLNLDDESLDDKFYDQLEECMDQCDAILDKNEKNVDAMFFKGGSLGFRGRLRAIRESWFKAALDGKDGLALIFKAYAADPKNVDIQLGFGIYHYYAEVIPQKYAAVKPFMVFFPKGDKAKGLKELDNVAWNGRYARVEARYFLLTLNFQFEENLNETAKWTQFLLHDYPNNPMFERYQGLIPVKQNDYKTASKTFHDIYLKCNRGMPGYNDRFKREATYYIGNDFLTRNIPDSAVYYFDQSEKLSQKLDKDVESGWQINSVLFLGMMNDLLGKRDLAVKYYNQSLRLKERNNSHQQAEEYLKKPYKKQF
jgi:tetratricopeptide (TPR) repeat protein